MSFVAPGFAAHNHKAIDFFLSKPVHLHTDLFEFAGVAHTRVARVNDDAGLAERPKTGAFEFVKEVVEVVVDVALLCEELVGDDELHFTNDW